MSHRVESVYFDGKGKQYTEETLKLAKKRAEELGIKNIVIASYTGYAGVLASEMFKDYNLVVSAGMMGFTEPNVHRMTDENKAMIDANGGEQYGLTLPPHQDVAFRIRGAADRGEQEYASHKVFVRSARDARSLF